MLRQIILDTETTGLSPDQGHRLIEIGCLEMINRRITTNHFHRYVNPKRPIDAGAVKVHGITEEFLKDKPPFADIADELLEYLKGAELIIHNAPFDLGFLNSEFNRTHPRQMPITRHCSVIDTLVMARREHPGQQNTLDALCRRYGVDNAHRDLHGALLDAELLAQVYLLMTGGQTQLFAAMDAEHDAAKKAEDVATNPVLTASPIPHTLPVILASAEELVSHSSFLDQIAKKGRCVWRED